MPIVSICIQKGGEGKTSTTVNLAAYLGLQKRKVLAIDFDSQANLTSTLHPERESNLSLADVIIDEKPFDQIIIPSNFDNVHLIPSNIRLAKLENYLTVSKIDSQFKLREIIKKNNLNAKYDVILIDTPPSLGSLTINALTASHATIVPVQCEEYSILGLQDFLETVYKIKETVNPNINILGVFINKYSQRRLTKKIEEEIMVNFKDLLFKTRIRSSVRVGEATLEKKPVFLWAPKEGVSVDMKSLCQEMMQRIDKIKGAK